MPEIERALFRGTVGEAAAVEFTAFLKVWRELPHPRAVLDDPGNADIPENASTLMALCGSLYRMASDVNLDAIVTYATRLRREVGESLVGACVRREPALQRSPGLHPLGHRQDAVNEGRHDPAHHTRPVGRYPPVDAPLNPRGGTRWTSTATPCWSDYTSPPGPAGSTTARRATMSPSPTKPRPAPGATTSACCPRPPSPR